MTEKLTGKGFAYVNHFFTEFKGFVFQKRLESVMCKT